MESPPCAAMVKYRAVTALLYTALQSTVYHIDIVMISMRDDYAGIYKDLILDEHEEFQ